MKPRASKLDQYAAQLADMETANKTIAEIQEWLKAEGCLAGTGTISVYLRRLRSGRQQAAILAKITSGARQAEEVEKQFAQNPAPAVETIIKLLRVQIMQLAMESEDKPELIEVANLLTKTVMDFVSGQTRAKLKERELSLTEERFKESLRTKLESAFNELALAVKGNPVAEEHILKARELIAPEK